MTMGSRPLTKPRCANCRRKKIKCDYQRPACGQCSRSSSKCEGYATKLVFVPHALQTKLSSQAVVRNVQGQFTERTLRANWIPSARTLNSSPYLTASIARTSVYSQFLLHYYPRSPTWWKTACTWVMEAFDGRHQFVPLQAAAGALGTTVIALVHGNNDFREYGLQLYGKALRDLRRANQFAYEYRWFDLLLTSMLLLSYEMLVPSMSDTSGIKGHSLGISSFLQMLGPKAFQGPGLIHTSFLYCRLSLIRSSILEETPTFLAMPTWRQIPWQVEEKNDLHKCLDIVSHISSLLHSTKSIPLLTADSTTASQQTWTQFKTSHDRMAVQLDTWYDELIGRKGKLFEVSPARESGVTTSAFADIHLFGHVGEAEVALFFWTSKLLLHDALWRMSRIATEAKLLAENGVSSVTVAADNILKTVPFCLLKDNGIIGTKFTILPLKTAHCFYQRWGMEDKVKSCLKYTELIASKGGVNDMAGAL